MRFGKSDPRHPRWLAVELNELRCDRTDGSEPQPKPPAGDFPLRVAARRAHHVGGAAESPAADPPDFT
jgi:hypothetical protein